MIVELLLVASSLQPNFNDRQVSWTAEKTEITHVNECHIDNGRRACRVRNGWTIIGSFPDNPNWIQRLRSTEHSPASAERRVNHDRRP